jgi:protein involved in ribonucleotide reduction
MDAFIAKYDSSGNEVWTRQFGTSGNDNALAMVADGSGDIYVAGVTWGTFSGQTPSFSEDAFIAKYDSSGNEVWTRQFGTSGHDWANAMVADGSGNIYVAGWTEGIFSGQASSGSGDAFIAKYDSSGNKVWTRQFGTSGDDYANAMVADGSGNIYVAGWTDYTFVAQTLLVDSDSFIAKYDSSGNELWTRQFGTSGNDSAYAMAADGSGNIYVAGDTTGAFSGQGSSGGVDAFIMKLRK